MPKPAALSVVHVVALDLEIPIDALLCKLYQLRDEHLNELHRLSTQLLIST
jgi:hypothetical protein